MLFQYGTTGVRRRIKFRDATTGAGKTGLNYLSTIKVAFARNGAAPVQITLVTQTVGGAWTAGGFVEVDATLAPGQYDVDVPNAAFLTGVNEGKVLWSGTGIIDDDEEYELVAYDPTAVDKTGFELDSTSRTAIVSDIFAGGNIDGLQLVELLRLAAAILFGNALTLDQATATFKNANGATKNRITITGNGTSRVITIVDKT